MKKCKGWALALCVTMVLCFFPLQASAERVGIDVVLPTMKQGPAAPEDKVPVEIEFPTKDPSTVESISPEPMPIDGSDSAWEPIDSNGMESELLDDEDATELTEDSEEKETKKKFSGKWVILFFGSLFLAIGGMFVNYMYQTTHPKFIGKLFLKFSLPEELDGISQQEDSDLIFPYVTKITTWKLIVDNTSMYEAMRPILAETKLENVAKSIVIESHPKREIWLKIKESPDIVAVNGEPVVKQAVVKLKRDDHAVLTFASEFGAVEMTMYRNPRATRNPYMAYAKTKEPIQLDEQTEQARLRLSAISEEVAQTAKSRNEENRAVSVQESINYYVFATVMGLIKQDGEQQVVRLYRDAMDFTPITLLAIGLIEKDLYYNIYRSFYTKLDRLRRESLDIQMRELLMACATDSDRGVRLENHARSMIVNYTTMKRSAQTYAEEHPESGEEQQKIVAFYSDVVDVCKELLSKIDV